MIQYRPAQRNAKRLLLDWVNLPSPVTDDWLDSMLAKHRDVFTPFAHDRTQLRNVIEKVRIFLQLAWKSKDARQRNWCLFVARQRYSRALLGQMPASKQNIERLLATVGGESVRPFVNVTEVLLVAQPPETEFDNATKYAKQMAYCEGPKCEEPYFLRGRWHEHYCPTCKPDAKRRKRKRYYETKEKFKPRRKAK